MKRVLRFRAGQQISGMRAQLNDIVDRVNQDTAPRGPLAPAPVSANFMLVVEIRGLDLPTPGRLQCVNANQQLNPSAFVYAVDPPWTLTEPDRDGTTYTYIDINNRTAANPTETQVLTPIYLIGDLLMIAIVDGRWRDLNLDARQWAQAAVPP